MRERSWTPEEFDWDEHNVRKNRDKHRVSRAECEEMLFNEPLLLAEIDESKVLYSEPRFAAYGRTDGGRLLFAVFTARGIKVRIISVRDMSRQERRLYHEEA